ncbi:MAG: methionyl-tRNA formyltransferase [Parcubacteria group bacterium]|nr:MAG: methionyl-tRNA formyltransferase [Parcubacteria group bacterium]
MAVSNKKIIFWGTPDFAIPSFRILLALGLVKAVVTQPDRPSGRRQKISSSPVKKTASIYSLPILCPERLDEDFVFALKKYLPATFVIVAYGKIIPQEILDLSELCAINIHPSALPVLRGPSPIQTALADGLKETAVTLIQLDDHMDHGPILAQQNIDISSEDNFESLSAKLAIVGGKILAGSIISYLDGGLAGKSQDDRAATFCKLIKKEDGDISWQDSALKIHNKVRAYNPWPSVYTDLNGIKIKLIKTKLSDQELRPAQFAVENNHFFVGTDDGSLEILEIQPEGKRIMMAGEFIRGYEKYLN